MTPCTDVIMPTGRTPSNLTLKPMAVRISNPNPNPNPNPTLNPAQGLFDPELLAARYDRILQHYGFTASQIERESQAAGRDAKALPPAAFEGLLKGLPGISEAPREFRLEGEEEGQEAQRAR